MSDTIGKDKLYQSIKHWERIHSYALHHWDAAIDKEGYSGSSCPCCDEFHTGHDDEGCTDCPVAIYVEQDYCQGTPWQRAADELNALVGLINPHAPNGNWNEAAKACKAELDFLNEVFEKSYGT